MKRYFSFLFVLIITLNGFADTKLPATVSASLPKILSNNLIKKSDTERLLQSNDYGQSDVRKSYWHVYSDRSDNVTYTAPGGGTAFSKLAFNEHLIIAKISGKYALVYSEGKKGTVYPQISEKAESKGWVPMSHLLLWKTCPTNDKLIYNKALLVNNLDHKKTDLDYALCFSNPDNQNSGQRLRYDMTFYFVMKEEGNMCLLARQYKMDGITDQVLYGWVGKGFFISWDQRSCLEPNWNKEDADYFHANNASAIVYENTSMTVPRCKMPMGRENTVSSHNESNKYRLNPGAIRFPLLNSAKGSNVYNCTAFAGSEGQTVDVPAGGGGEENVIIDKRLKEKSRINIIIVIDGTKSMENFYEPMQKAIQQANEFFGTKNREVKVGVVIYRDYCDGQFLTEVQPMVAPTDPTLAAFLHSGGKYGVKSSANDRTYAEALYKGLEVALDTKRMEYSPAHSNIMFVVGDCGNDLDDKRCLTQEAIINKMAANNIQICSFQVRNMNEQSFLLFRRQMNEIVKGDMQTQYGQLNERTDRGFKEITNGNEFVTKTGNAYYMGSTHYASLGQEMPAVNLYELIKSRFERFDAVLTLWLKAINNADIVFGGGQDNNGTMDEKFLETIYTPDEIAKLKKNAGLMACSGYTPKKDASSGRDYWKPVLYISSDELNVLREKLRPVADVAKNGGTDRRPYINAIKALIRSQLPDLSDEDLNNMSVPEIMSVMGGLNVGIEGATGGHSLNELQNETLVPQSEFDAMVQNMYTKYRKLERMANQNYEFKVTRNNATYYWLPAEDLIPTASSNND